MYAFVSIKSRALTNKPVHLTRVLMCMLFICLNQDENRRYESFLIVCKTFQRISKLFGSSPVKVQTMDGYYCISCFSWILRWQIKVQIVFVGGRFPWERNESHHEKVNSVSDLHAPNSICLRFARKTIFLLSGTFNRANACYKNIANTICAKGLTHQSMCRLWHTQLR